MQPLTAAVIGLAVLGVLLAGLLLTRPSVTFGRAGRVIAFLSLFFLPLLGLGLGVQDQLERSKQTDFCLSCHVMEPYGKSLRADDSGSVPAVHYQNHLVEPQEACFVCHTDYTMYGDVSSKLRGLRHVWVYYVGDMPEKIALYEPYNNRECLHCHAGARSFEEGVFHTIDEETMAQIKSNELSCISSGCHETIHLTEPSEELDYWKGAGR